MRDQSGLVLTKLLALVLLFGALMLVSVGVSVDPALATDSDGDGLSDALEQVLGTATNDTDTDDDNLTDFEEVFVYGTDPTNPDTDCDAQNDDTDSDPLDNGDSAGGRMNPTGSYSGNLVHEAVVGTTPTEGFHVNALSGEMALPLASIDFGPGYRDRYVMQLYYRSGITHDGPWGRNVVCNWDWWVEEQGSGDIEVYMFGQVFLATEDSGEYTSPAGFPFVVEKDGGTGVITVTAIRGGKVWTFDATDGWLESIEDRFGNEIAIARDVDGLIETVTLPEGNEIEFTTYGTGRYETVTDWSTSARTWTLTYNYFAELAQFEDALGNTTQFYYMNGSFSPDLNANLVRILNPTGSTRIKVEYDSSDRVTKQSFETYDCTFSYTSTATTVNDFAGNQRVWNHAAGSNVPTSLVAYSNRDVRATDPSTWTTSFAHNTNLLLTKVVHPAGNRTDFDWNANYCLTEIRKKETDTDTDDNDDDLVWTNTYGSTYYQLEDSTDPNGNTTERTLDALERVTGISYETITHTDPDVTITESLTWNSTGQLTQRTDGEGVVTKYDYYSTGAKKGLLYQKTRDYGAGKLNLVWEYDYDEWRFVTDQEDPDGNAWTITRDALGRATETHSPYPQGYEVWNTYSADGFLIYSNVENVDEANQTDETNPWWRTDYGRDAHGRLTSVSREIAHPATFACTSFSHDGNGNVILITRPEGNKIQQVFDERGLLAEKTRAYQATGADPSTEKWKYDANRNLTEHENGRGKKETRTYDDLDRLEKITTPVGHYTTFVLDKNGNVKEVKGYDDDDTLLAWQKAYYDELNRLWKVERWLDHPAPTADDWMATVYTHDKCGRVIMTTDPESHDTEITYDAIGRQKEWEDHLGNKVTYSFANDWQVPTQIQEIELVPGGGTETFTTEQVTDAFHRVTERRIVDRNDSQNKRIFKWKYDSLSVAVEQEDAEGKKTYREHDGLGRVMKEWVDMGGGAKIETLYTYDDNSNLIMLTDDSGNETGYAYNARDLQYEIEYDNGDSRTFTFNDDDSVAGWTDENGTVVANTHDDDGRLTGRAISRATGVLGPTSESYTYDGLGRLTEATNNNSTVERVYDTLSRLTSETQGPNPLNGYGKTVSYTYNDDGSRASCTYPSGFEIDYTVDAVGRWTKIEDSVGNDLVEKSFYGPGLRTKQVSYLNGTSENYGYDGFRFVTDIDHKDSQSTTFAGFDYAFDKMGNPKYEERTHDGGKGDIYAYDNAHRLTAALISSDDPSSEVADSDWVDYAYTEKIDYNLDDVSNRTSVVKTPYQGQAQTTSYTVNWANWYTVVGGVSRTHDTNGNLTYDGTYTYAYDYRNNLTKVTEGQTTVAEYEFDPLNRRTKKTNATQKQFYDGWHVVEVYDSSDNLKKKFVFGQSIDDIRVMIAPDIADVDDDQDTSELVNLYFHHKLLGTVTHLTDPNENVVEQYLCDPYGGTEFKDGQGNDIGSDSAVGNPFVYTGRWWDGETGLYHYRMRAYNPACGRFLQRDPAGYLSGGSLYLYALSNPCAYADPLGLDPPGHAADNKPGDANTKPGAYYPKDGETPTEFARRFFKDLGYIPPGLALLCEFCGKIIEFQFSNAKGPRYAVCDDCKPLDYLNMLVELVTLRGGRGRTSGGGGGGRPRAQAPRQPRKPVDAPGQPTPEPVVNPSKPPRTAPPNYTPPPRELNIPGARKVSPKGGGRARWETRKRIYEWDGKSRHLEVYNKRGQHLGTSDLNGNIRDGSRVNGRTCER